MTTMQAQPRNFALLSPSLPPLAPVRGSASPTHDQIALRAFEIYVASDRQPGRCTGNWQRAEGELALAPHPPLKSRISPLA